MLGGHERADEMERRVPDRFQILLRVVALVEDERDMLGSSGDLAAALGQARGEAAEGGGVGAIAGIGPVQQRQAEIGRHEQGQADDAQGLAAFLAVTALGELGALVEGVDVGEEIGGVEEHLPEVDVEDGGHAGDDVAFDGLDGGRRETVHVVPEALAGELAGADGEQAGQDGGVEPAGEAGLGAGSETAVQDRGQQVGADGGAGAALGGVAVDVLDEAQARGDIEQGGAGSEVAHDGGFRLLGGGVAQLAGNVVNATEVLLGDDLGLAVDTLALAHVVVRVAADDFLHEARHGC